MKNNSIIYKNPQDQYLFDLSQIGTCVHTKELMDINQENHFFQVGDVLYYNIKDKIFAKAVAVNNIESEVCGLVSAVQDNNNFTIVNNGIIETDKYSFDEGTILYLSDAHPGKLVSIAPADVVKQIATQLTNGIMVDIQRGYRTINPSSSEELEPYTQSELDEIIKNIW